MNTANQTILDIPKEVKESSSEKDSGSVTSSESSTSFEYNPTIPDCSNKTHCWTEPEAENFYVRGPNYLNDKKKSPIKPTFVAIARSRIVFDRRIP